MPMINGKHVVFDSPETEAAFDRMTGRHSGDGGVKAVIVIVILAVIGGIVWWIAK